MKNIVKTSKVATSSVMESVSATVPAMAAAQNNEIELSNKEERIENEDKKMVSHFDIHRVELRGMNNYEAFDVVRRAVENRKVLRMLVTPGVDKNNCPYYWIGLRYDINEIVFKLLVNEEISVYIMAFLKGDEEMPEVTTCVPDTITGSKADWLEEHKMMQSVHAESRNEVMTISNGRNFLCTKLKFQNGKISYSEEYSDILSFLKPDEQ